MTFQHRKLSLFVLVALAATVFVVLASPSLGAGDRHRGSSASGKYYPPVLIDPILSTLTRPGDGDDFSAGLLYGGGLNYTYPKLGKGDVVPAVRVTLTLPPGTRIVKSSIRFRGIPNDGSWFPVVPPSSLRWAMVRGRPTWLFRDLHQGEGIGWHFSLSSGGNTACVKATAEMLYPRRVQVGKRVVTRLVPIPHAPVQSSQSDGCDQAATTTTP